VVDKSQVTTKITTADNHFSGCHFPVNRLATGCWDCWSCLSFWCPSNTLEVQWRWMIWQALITWKYDLLSWSNNEMQ